MPVWHGIMSKQQISDIVACLHAGLPAVPGAEPAPVPTGQGEAVAGSILYSKPPIVSMPHWGSVLTDAEANALIAYIGTLS